MNDKEFSLPKDNFKIKVNNPDNLHTIDYKILKELQGDLKVTSSAKIEKLKKSIIKYGVFVPKFVWIDNNTYYIEDGHQTIKALKELEGEDYYIPPIPYVAIEAKDRKEAGEKLLMINSKFADINPKTSFFNDFNIDLDFIKDIEIPELDILLDFVVNTDTREDKTPEVPAEPISKVGDLWLCGVHRVLCGDSLNAEDVKILMNNEKAVLMATDPPYGDSWVQKAKDMNAQGYVHSSAVLYGTIESDDLSVTELKMFLDSFLECAKLAGDAPMPIYVWHGAKRMVFEQALIDAGYLVHQSVVWVKKSFVIGRLHYHPRCELALHGWLTGNGKCPFYGKRNQSDVWEINRENDKVHPTQKPVELFTIPILNHTKHGEIVYEPFAGSGTQLIAAEQTGRICYSMEIAPRYIDVILDRYYQFTGDDPIRESDGKKWSELND
jgi:hypothetical protein